MHRKYVYLFELDSVRKTDEDIIEGQKAIYNEIVQQGNIVVMTYNQLVDSRGFFSLLSNASYYEQLMKLFELGCIRISQFGDVRTITQYLLDAMDEDKQFIYSALPIKYTQKRLTALLRRSLTFSDLSEISEYFEGGRRSEAELRDLFLEVACDDSGRTLFVKPAGEGRPVSELRGILHNLYYFLSIVLQLSALPQIYIPPRKTDEYKEYRMHQILSYALELSFSDIPYWMEAVNIIRGLPCFQAQVDGRSVYYRQILADFKKKENLEGLQKRAFYLAEAVVDLCYNYACEISICNTSKHYNISELSKDCHQRPTFEADFRRRLLKHWKQGRDAEKRFLTEETDTFMPFTRVQDIPDFKLAVRAAGYTNYDISYENEDIPRYEYQEVEQRGEQRREIRKGIGHKTMFTVLCFLVACVVELLMQGAQNMLDDYVDINDTVYSVVETLLFLVLTEAFSAFLSFCWPGFLSLSQALGGIRTLAMDAIHTHRSNPEEDSRALQTDYREKKNGEAHIDFVRTKEIKSYMAYRSLYRDSGLFTDSSVCPLADMSASEALRAVIRDDEIYHHKYGLIYQSRFNTFLVDPVAGTEGHLFPYERVIPTAGNGVVMAARYRGKFLLLKQFRHALRADQYSFPRGYAEPGDSPLENVKRELKEELNAVVSRPPISLGYIEPDSGLTSRKIEIFLVDVDEYSYKKGYEEILDVKEMMPKELEKAVREGKITDGYTLGAVLLMKEKFEI